MPRIPLTSDLIRLEEQRRFYESTNQAKSTTKYYRESWLHFCRWCDLVGFPTTLPSDPDHVALYVAAIRDAGLSAGTLQMRLTSIAQKHKRSGFPSPVNESIRRMMAGARRSEKPGGKAALTVDHLRRGLALPPPSKNKSSLVSLRDKALLLIGFSSGMRRGELTGLDLKDIEWQPQGLRLKITHSKTDQEWEGRYVGIFAATDPELCPLKALSAWLAKRGNFPGPLFPRLLSGKTLTHSRLGGPSVNNLVKRLIERLGLDPKQYGGHSLRIGFCTAAVESGASTVAIMARTGHKDTKMVHRYTRPASAFTINPKVL